MKFINYGKQFIDEADIKGVVEVLKSDFLTQGSKVKEFENYLCEYTGAKYCVAVSNGTAALHLAVASLNIENGMEGITSPNSFVATANSMVYNNISPVFVDICPKTYNITASVIKSKLNERSRLVIPVHFAGQTCDMKRIFDLKNEYKKQYNETLFIIEDAAHAIGSCYEDGSKVGNCKYSDLTIFSFHPVKTITTGEGGAITTNNEDFYKKLLQLRNHGVTKEGNNFFYGEDTGPWYYEMQSLGFNYRMTDIQASLGITQLRKLEFFIYRREEIVQLYNESFRTIDWITVPFYKERLRIGIHLYVILIDFSKIGKSKSEVMEQLRYNGIGTQVHYIPIHSQPYYRLNYGYKKGDFPISEKYYEGALSIPLFPKMTNEMVRQVVKNIVNLK